MCEVVWLGSQREGPERGAARSGAHSGAWQPPKRGSEGRQRMGVGRKEAGSSCGQKSFNGNDPAHSPAWDKPVEASLNTAADWDPDNYKSAPVAEDPESCRVYANP